MKKIYLVSLILNILFAGFFTYFISKRGGVGYLKEKVAPSPVTIEHYDTDFYLMKKSLFEVLPNDSDEIIFVGNSITANCNWSELFSDARIKNRGIGDDVIQGVIARLDEILEAGPKKIFIEIGINDLERKHSIEQIVSEYDSLVALIKKKSPSTEIYLESLLPTNNVENRSNADIKKINQSIQRIAASRAATYINLFDCLTDAKGELDMQYSLDGLHLNGKGYLILKSELNKFLSR
jgi:lysophospholipase L1-like esterase